MKMEILPLYDYIMIMPYTENPYMKHTTDTGLVLTDGLVDSSDSGEVEKETYGIRVARIIGCGPECKYVKEGDDIMYAESSARPVPFFDNGFWVLNERSIITVVNEGLTERFKKD